MTASYTVKTAKDSAASPQLFSKAMQDKDGTGSSFADVTALRNSSGADIDPATDQSVQSLVAALGSPITGASMPAGGVGWYGWLSAIWSTTATADNQTTANTTLSSILTKLGAVVLSGGSAIIGKVGIDQTTPGATNGVVVNSGAVTANAGTNLNTSALALETGGNLASIAANVSTAANQTTANTSLASILTKLSGTLATAGANPAAILSNRQLTTTGAVALPSQALVNGAVIKALSTNTGAVYVGPSGVSSSTGYPLAAGEAVSYAVTNLSAIFIIGTNTTDAVAFTGN